MLVSGTMSERETTSSFPDKLPGLSAAPSACQLKWNGNVFNETKEGSNLVCIIIWRGFRFMSYHCLLYLGGAPWSRSVFADLCTSTPTDLQRWSRFRGEMIKIKRKSKMNDWIHIILVTVGEESQWEPLCCLEMRWIGWPHSQRHFPLVKESLERDLVCLIGLLGKRKKSCEYNWDLWYS